MALVTWDDTFSVGVRSLDDQHTVLFGTLNELHAAMLKGQAKAITARLLKDLLTYTRQHFSTEEAMLTAAKYPGLPQHQLKHRELTKEVVRYVERFERGEIALDLHLLVFLRDWLTQHIQKDDRAYGAWLNTHGVR